MSLQTQDLAKILDDIDLYCFLMKQHILNKHLQVQFLYFTIQVFHIIHYYFRLIKASQHIN